MAMETLSSSELLDFIIYDTISAIPFSCNVSSDTTSNLHLLQQNAHLASAATTPNALYNTSSMNLSVKPETNSERSLAVQGRKKRRRRPKVCKNKEEAENQRMTHITVERNRRKQMNEHLAVLRSLMPDSYVQRGDQASIVGGAIDFVKELEHILQSLEAQKFLQMQESREKLDSVEATPFSQFFTFPQFTTSQTPNKHYTCTKTNGAIADIEVTLIETHANIRVLSRRRLRQLSKIIGGFQAVYMTILHLNVTTLEPMVLYSISTKIEEGCPLKTADDIGGATHEMLRMIEEEEEVVAGLQDYGEDLG
ncbi:hypothetical protein DCAR_0104613 [Daucus carota subsp. sativus]|uniref:BHLH domain-containing protein n=1 Tax=Daucus carota subsp. sativus TaxID=79200 RepID=A0A166IYP9_DAUCS|nr:PREDICTED: transcription factor bHLH71-like [Daucus carota subsp. sativus]WOG85424.1 hypothetical protein DCAR_0104613 [Daucus carota subsp. sativus]